MTTNRTGRTAAPPDRAVLHRVVYPLDGEPERLDRVVSILFPAFPTRKSARKAARRGEIAVDGEISESSRWIEPGAVLVWLEPATDRTPPLAIPVPVVYEDPWLAVVHKPAGLPTSGPLPRTLERALPVNLSPSPEPDALARPRVVHRLDGPTQGLVVVAKTRKAHAALGAAFADRRIDKRYRALATGRIEGASTIDAPIEGRNARTRYRAVEHSRALRTGWISTLDLFPETGRTHQIRRHLASLEHPVLGDGTYGQPGRTLRGQGLFLAAVALAFSHPTTGEPLALSIGEPEKFGAFRAREARRWARHHQTDDR